MAPIAKEFEQNQGSADHNRRISDVESVPMVATNVEVDEIGNAMADDAVQNIPCSAAEDQRHTPLAEPAPGAIRDQQPRDQSDHRHRKQDQQRRAPGHLGVSQQSESHARITGMNEIQDAGNQDAARSRLSEILDGVLARLIQNENDRGENGQEPCGA